MTRAVRLIRSDRLSDVADYACAATAPGGARLVFLAGACPLDEAGATVSPGDYAAQAAQCVDNMEVALDEAGASIDDVIYTRVLVAAVLRLTREQFMLPRSLTDAGESRAWVSTLAAESPRELLELAKQV